MARFLPAGATICLAFLGTWTFCAEAQSKVCKDLEIVAYAHLGDNHVEPFAGLPIHFYLLNWRTFGERILNLGKTDSNGKVTVSKSELRRILKDIGDDNNNYLEIHLPLEDFGGKVGQTLDWYPSLVVRNMPIKKLARHSEKNQAIRELADDQNCQPLVITEDGVLDGSGDFLKQSLTAMWSLKAGEKFLKSVQPNLRDRRATTMRVEFSADWTGGTVLRTNVMRVMRLGLRDQYRTAFMTLHELGHALAYDFLDIKDAFGDHDHSKCYSTELALNEGWSSFFAMAALNFAGAQVQTDGVTHTADDFVFKNFSRNYNLQSNAFLVQSFSTTPPCNTAENETVVYNVLYAFYKDLKISFEDIWSALQTDSGQKIDSIATVKNNLIAKHPQKREQIEATYKNLVKD